jgi:sporulation protein YlmC with PRC-barrel domain
MFKNYSNNIYIMEVTNITMEVDDKNKRDFIIEKNKVTMMNYIQEYKYLVIDYNNKSK